MAELTLFIRDTGGNFYQGFGPGEDSAGSGNEDVDNIGTFSSLRISVLLQHLSLGTPTGNIYLRVNSNNFDETILLTAFSAVEFNNPKWFEVSFTDGPYLIELNNRLAFHVNAVGADRTGLWMCQDFHGSLDVLVRSYGTELTAPNKATNPDPSDTGTGVVLFPTLSWSAG
ncbi:hypothetical protein LCGC14_1348700 [marine sediment metagenome]|uniref:Uncharacterized protein n=1 Tax=marine sediment metagenome TaxID=412755 RepID=A0A0F9KC64_9ZZZZ